MAVQQYLPSRQFSLIVGSILLSGGLVLAARTLTTPPQTTSSLAVANTAQQTNTANWVATLNDIQAQQTARLPTPPNQDTVASLLQGSKTNNLTESVGRSLLINVTNANAQGLGADQPTQSQLVAAAMQQINSISVPTKPFTLSDMTVVPDSKDAVHAYANALVPVLLKHPHANMAEVLQLFNRKISKLDDGPYRFSTIAADYAGLARDLIKTPTPESLVQYHLQIVNDYSQMADSCAHMQEVTSDPMRGLAGFQLYNERASDVQQMFINIAQVFAKDGILFTKGEAGNQLGSLLSGQ